MGRLNRPIRAWMISILGMTQVGCLFPETVNKPLKAYAPNKGYRFANLEAGPGNSDGTFVCLALSGGGTRAAAFAYGVMQGLRDLPAVAGSAGGGSMLDEVDIISSVSGGSFAAMGYGIWRDDFFNGRFETRFLDLNLNTELIRIMLNPINALRLPFVVLDRIDVVASYYDERIFDQQSYADLIAQNQRPFIVINSTNLATSQRVEFTQADFDLLGSDLGSVPVGWSVAASSAFPVVFSPLRLKYHEAPSGMHVIHDHVMRADESPLDTRLERWARNIATREPTGSEGRYALDQEHHKYLYLADGGLVDNLGLTHVIDSYQRGDIRKLIDAGKIKRLIVISVDAGVEKRTGIEQQTVSPGIFMQAFQAGSIGVDNHSASLVRIMNHLMHEEPRIHADAAAAVRDVCPDAESQFMNGRPTVERHFVHIGFHQIPNRDDRERFYRMKTSLFLPKGQVDDLIALGHRLVTEGLGK